MSAASVAEPRLQVLARLRDNFEEFASNCLQIRAKDTKLVPLVFNPAQRALHAACEEQLLRKGWVRKIVLKGRRQGISTYVEARFYHKSSLKRGINTFILAHDQAASDALFGMVDRFHKNNPLAPVTGSSNIRELEFSKLDSNYFVGTAGSKATGRGKASTLMHASEVAFWPNASDHFASSIQTVPLMPGTEIILESTANGTSGEFFKRWHDAIAGVGDYEAVFLPWFMQSEYARPDLVTPDFVLSAGDDGSALSEAEYAEMFNLSLEQMAWRRSKIQELGSVVTFDVEYPGSPALAFQSKKEGVYHDAMSVLRARKRKGVEGHGPLIMGVDPAGEGGDRFAIAFRRGLKVEKVIWRDKINAVDAVDWLQVEIDEADPAVVFIDAGGIGAGIISLLRSKGSQYQHDRVKAVNFGAKSQAKTAKPHAPGPKNKRAEMQKRLKEWLELPEGVSLPDLDDLQADLTETRVKPTLTNDLQLESKQEIRARGSKSPDLQDAIGLTFADTFFVSNWKPKVDRSPEFGELSMPRREKPLNMVEQYRPKSQNGWMVG